MQDPILKKAQRTLDTAIFWFFGCGSVAIYTGVSVHPSAAYTVGAAMMGVVWAVLLITFWRTRPAWATIATVILVLGLSFVRDCTFPGAGILRGIYGGAVALAAGNLFLRIFRRTISRLCRLDRNAPSA